MYAAKFGVLRRSSSRRRCVLAAHSMKCVEARILVRWCLQDTIPICPPILSQHVALASAAMGRAWVQQQLSEVVENKEQLRTMLIEVLGEANVYGGQGAIYLMVRLPSLASGGPADDVEVVRMFARDEGVVVIPGSSCGAPGFVRVAYANLPRAKCDEAISRLRKGLARLTSLC